MKTQPQWTAQKLRNEANRPLLRDKFHRLKKLQTTQTLSTHGPGCLKVGWIQILKRKKPIQFNLRTERSKIKKKIILEKVLCLYCVFCCREFHFKTRFY